MKQPIEPFLNFIQDDTWSQAQSEALVDLMVWTMYVDRSIRVEENEELDIATLALNTNSALPITQYLPESIAKIRHVWTNEAESEVLLHDIAMYLDTQELQEKALRLCTNIAEADAELAEEETAFLNRLKAHFG